MMMKVVTAFALIAGVTFGTACHASQGRHLTGAAKAVSGDELRLGNTRVRLAGIDAPKRLQHCQDGDGRSYACGEQAYEALQRMTEGARTTCDVNGLVATCHVGSRDVGKELLRLGLAIPSTDANKDYRAIAEQAKQFRSGIWQGFFLDPTEWKKAFKSNPIVKQDSARKPTD